MLLRGSAAIKSTPQMDVHDGFPIVIGHFKEHIVANHPGVVDQDIQPAKVRNGFVNGVPHHRGISHVALKDQRLRAERANLGGHAFTSARIKIDQCHARALFGQAQGSRGTNASAGASDKRNPSVKSSHTFSPDK
jgi:hypothetical protein